MACAWYIKTNLIKLRFRSGEKDAPRTRPRIIQLPLAAIARHNMSRLNIIILIVLLSCTRQPGDLREHLNGWEILTTYRVLPSRTIKVEEKLAKIFKGDNDVLIVELEQKPIFKPGNEVTDLQSIRTLFIELTDLDTLVTPQSPGNSKLLRQIIAFSPKYGAHPLDKEEQIQIKRINEDSWTVNADLEDFQFQGHFNFGDSTIATNRYKKMYE